MRMTKTCFLHLVSVLSAGVGQTIAVVTWLASELTTSKTIVSQDIVTLGNTKLCPHPRLQSYEARLVSAEKQTS